MLAAAERAVREAPRSLEGKAQVEAYVDAQGVLHVAVLDASRDRAGWDTLVPLLVRSLDSLRQRVPRGARWRGVVSLEVRV